MHDRGSPSLYKERKTDARARGEGRDRETVFNRHDLDSRSVQNPIRPSTQLTRRRLRRRSLLLVALLLGVMAGMAIWGKGRGYKTRVAQMLGLQARHTPRPAAVPSTASEAPADPSIRFEQVALPAATCAQFTCVEIGPDHRLYVGADDGRILRFSIRPDGTLADSTVISSLQRAEGGKRLLIGFCFDPASTAADPVLWASHGFFAFHQAPDFTGKITRLRGPDLQIVEDAVIHLPRSTRDHLNNKPVFGPDGALYIPQGSNTASGAPDEDWDMRPERLLSASILRLDVHKLVPDKPLDVLTRDGGGSYDPSTPGAPLTIYATGLRNAYALLWAQNGWLYAPVNGSNPGGAAPAGPGVPPLRDLPISEHDWLFRVTPGKYYGHPNPQQGHYVLNGGNPGDRHDAAVITEYPLGTRPDPDWEPAVFDFGEHVSPNGIIQYRGGACGGRLDGKILVCRFNVGQDLICLQLDASGNVKSFQTHMAGASALDQPLDLVEDVVTGNIYVAEYGGQRVMLLRPLNSAATAPTSPDNRGPIESAAVARGKKLFEMTCVACHGPSGRGIPNVGANLVTSQYVAGQSDEALAAFIESGRQPTDPQSVMKLAMPPNGANPLLDDAGRRDVVAYLRWLEAHR